MSRYTPIYLRTALRYFVNNIQINIYQGNFQINLIDYLPLFRLGYTTLSNIENTMLIYKQLHPDYYIIIWEQSFNMDIPAKYYTKEFDQIVTMRQAVETGMIDKELNTNQLLGEYDKYEDYVKHDLDDITEDYIKYNSDDIPENNLPSDFLEKLKHEDKILQDIAIILGESYDINDPIKGDMILELWVELTKDYAWDRKNVMNILLDHNEFKLYIAIINDEIGKVKEYINIVDPRFDDNQAYILAVKYGNQEIIKLIKDQIIKNNWYEKQVYLNNIGSEGGDVFGQIKK